MPTPEVQQIPSVPPRPSRSPTKETSPSLPLAPPRPINTRLERSRSPNPARFAQSPLNGGINPRTSSSGLLSPYGNESELTALNDGSNNHHMPSVGEEGMEYSVVAADIDKDQEASPEQTRMVGEDIKLHAPRPSLPAESAKRRVMAVTRTNSDRAAALGFGKGEGSRAASRESLRRKPSSTGFITASEQAQLLEDEHGIPEIGQRVPMNRHLGDVQAPSPVAGGEGHVRHHSRKLSGRSLPPGSYGMHGHGVASQDELEKAYYKKHPEMLARDQHTPLHDRQNDFAMSSSDLNKLVRDTASRAADRASSVDYRGTPADEVGFRASEEYARRSSVEMAVQEPAPRGRRRTIHIEDPKHSEYYHYGGDADSPVDAEGEGEYSAPILASDEVEKEPKKSQHPVVRPRLERNDSSYSQDGRSSSRPSSRPTSVYNAVPIFDHTRLENVEEYEPLFPDDAAKNEEKPVERKHRHHFPSKDVWEDAPGSAFETAEVSTPDQQDEPPKRSSLIRESRPMTPAQAFALQQEQLAEKEAGGRKHKFLPLVEDRPRQEQRSSSKLGNGRRFPSRDVWEDAPESSLYEAEVSESKEQAARPGIPARPMKKTGELLRPPLPDRPSSVVGLKEETVRALSAASSPTQTHHMPAVPPRPARKASSDSKDDDASKPRSVAPTGSDRPVAGKIAALKAGFMSDLNKRLSQGPSAAKKEEPVEEDALAAQVEKVPLTDARKGRARGPQRRAPTRAPAVATISEESAARAEPAVLSISSPQMIWSIDPDDGSLVFVAAAEAEEASEQRAERAVETSSEEVVVLEGKMEEDLEVEKTLERDSVHEEAQLEVSSEAKDEDEADKIESRTDKTESDGFEVIEREAEEARATEEIEDMDVGDEFESSDESAAAPVTEEVEESGEVEVVEKAQESEVLEEDAKVEVEVEVDIKGSGNMREVEETQEGPKESQESVESASSSRTEEPPIADVSAGSSLFRNDDDNTDGSEDFQEAKSQEKREEGSEGVEPHVGAAEGIHQGPNLGLKEGVDEGIHEGRKTPAARDDLHADPAEEEVHQKPAHGVDDPRAAEASGHGDAEASVQAASVAAKSEEHFEGA